MTLLEFPLASEIERLLRQRVPPTRGSVAGSWSVAGPLTKSGQSVTYRATCPGLPHPLLIKRLDGVAKARSQHEALRRARERFTGCSGLSVPIVYPYLLDDGFVVMEWVEGPTIQQVIERPRSRLEDVISAIASAGRWLRAFHGDGQPDRGFLEVDEMLDTIRLGMGGRIGWSGNPRSFVGHCALLESTSELVKRIPTPFGVKHGDFKPSNVMLEGVRVIGIDISADFPGPMVNDVAHFLLHLDLLLYYPVAWRFLPWRARLRSAFLHSYCVRQSPADNLVLAWVQLQWVLRHYYDRVEMEKDWSRISMLTLCYGRLMRRRAIDLQRAFGNGVNAVLT